MTKMTLFVIFLVLFGATGLVAQQKAGPTVTMHDGGSREVLESIYVPPIAAAPFTLTLATEWTRPMATGGTYTAVNERRIGRDSEGRIYQERWLLVPKGGKFKSEMNVIQIADPVEHILYNCFTAEKQCRLLPFAGSPTDNYKPTMAISGPLPDGSGFRTHEELGTKNVAGMDTLGYRDTVVLNPGVIGNDQPAVSKREFWYSPALGINLLSTLESPQVGKQRFTVTEVSTSAPEPQLFQIPQGYQVIDLRKTKLPSKHLPVVPQLRPYVAGTPNILVDTIVSAGLQS